MSPSEAFETYYALGTKRNLLRLAKVVGQDFETLKNWSDGYAWDEKIEARDKELDRVVESEYRRRTQQIRNSLVNQVQRLLEDMDKCKLGLPFSITSPADFRCVSQAYKELVQANVMAISKGIDVSGGKAPKTWSDLIQQLEYIEEADKSEDGV